MAALTGPRNTLQFGLPTEPVLPSLDVGVKANAKLYAGAIVVIDATGYAIAGATATGLIAVGRAHPITGNVADATGLASGALVTKVDQGVFRWNNSSAGDLIAATDIGARCYIVDDNTVAKTSATNTRSPAGIIYGVDSATGGVYVLMGLWVGMILKTLP